MTDKTTSIRAKSGLAAYALATMSIVIGAGSLIVFTVFLYIGSFHVTRLEFRFIQALLFNACLCMAFFLQHSGMVRTRARCWMSSVIPEYYISAVFSVVSGVVLLTLVMLWQESTLVLVSADGIYRFALRACFFLAIAVQVWGIWSLKSADLFGTDAVLRHQSTTQQPTPIVIRGPYRWVRHPLYLTTLLMIWSYPDLTADRLLFNALFTAWIIVGTILEERDLIAVYGDDYRRYRHAVPILIPYRKPRGKTS